MEKINPAVLATEVVALIGKKIKLTERQKEVLEDDIAEMIMDNTPSHQLLDDPDDDVVPGDYEDGLAYAAERQAWDASP